MKRNAIAALLLVAGVVGVGAFAVGSESATAAVRSVEVVETECDDGSYRSSVRQRPADGGTRVVVEDAFVGPAPDHTLDAAVTEASGNYTLTLSARAATTDGDAPDCTGKIRYRAAVFVPADGFDLEVVHGDETHVVLRNDGNSSSASSDSTAVPDSNSTATATAAN